MTAPAASRTKISWFVVLWMGLFLYETFRLNLLSPLAGVELPKFKFLYPPAGWIMFYHVDRTYGFAEVYGVTARGPEPLDPHDIFGTRNVLYDNIRRNVLVSVLSPTDAAGFCAFLFRKFPRYEGFTVASAFYPDLIERPDEILRRVAYQCRPPPEGR